MAHRLLDRAEGVSHAYRSGRFSSSVPRRCARWGRPCWPVPSRTWRRRARSRAVARWTPSTRTRAMREPAPEEAAPLEPLLAQLFDRWIPSVVHDDRTRLLRLHPRRRPVPGRARRPHRRHDEPVHRHLAGGARTGPARSERPRLVPRLDAVPPRRPRAADHGRIDGELQRHRRGARAAPRSRDSAAACSTRRTRCTTRS